MRLFFIITFVLLLCNKTNCQDFTSFGLNIPTGYDLKNNRFNSGITFNSYVWYLNFSLDYKINSKINPDKNNDFLIFGGLGYYNYYQLQFGQSSSKITYIRQRTDWTLSELGFVLKNRKDWDYNPLNSITLSAFIDKTFNDSRQNWIVGVGIGYCIRVTGITH